MKQLQNEKSMAEMLASENALLFVWVNWSDYANRGSKVAEEVEALLASKSCNQPVSWWIGDFSSTASPIDRVAHQWLTEQEQRGTIHVFPNIATGNGSVVWIRRGQIVSFAASALGLGPEGILRRTEEVFR